MDPQSDKVPGLGLPSPSMPQGGPFDPAAMPPVASQPPMQALPPAALPNAAVPLPQMSQAALSAPAPDESSDSLDEEWVNKAKAIVEKTKNDPYTESQELGKMKAEFLRIRYNKQVKTAEDKSQ
jgi:hypothetical protein